MEYPSDFETPAFPAGKRIAISRFMTIGVAILSLLILFMCGIIFWTSRSQSIDPFIVSIDNLTGNWTVISNSHNNAPIEYSALRSLQEAVVGKFTSNWLTISADEATNEKIWKTCDRETSCTGEKAPAYGNNECALFCAAGEKVFSKFVYDIVPDYQNRVAAGESWTVDKTTIMIEPASTISENGGTWRIRASIQSSVSGEIDIIAFAKITRNTRTYPQTLGYYVEDFNAYKIN